MWDMVQKLQLKGSDCEAKAEEIGVEACRELPGETVATRIELEAGQRDTMKKNIVKLLKSLREKGLSRKEINYVFSVVSGLPKEEAYNLAYRAETVANTKAMNQEIARDVESLPRIRKGLALAYKILGINDDLIAKVMFEGLSAKKKQYFAYMGKVGDEREEPDFDTREKYLRLFHRIAGDVTDNRNENVLQPLQIVGIDVSKI